MKGWQGNFYWWSLWNACVSNVIVVLTLRIRDFESYWEHENRVMFARFGGVTRLMNGIHMNSFQEKRRRISERIRLTYGLRWEERIYMKYNRCDSVTTSGRVGIKEKILWSWIKFWDKDWKTDQKDKVVIGWSRVHLGEKREQKCQPFQTIQRKMKQDTLKLEKVMEKNWVNLSWQGTKMSKYGVSQAVSPWESPYSEWLQCTWNSSVWWLSIESNHKHWIYLFMYDRGPICSPMGQRK